MHEKHLKKITCTLISIFVLSLISLCLDIGSTYYMFHKWNDDLADVVNTSNFEDPLDDLIDQGEFDTVISHCNEREKSHPYDLNVYYYRGLALYYQGKTKEALTDFEKVIDTDPTWSYAQEYIDVIKDKKTPDFLDDDLQDLIEKGKFKIVISQCDTREKSHPYDLNVYYYRGLALYYQGKTKAALTDFEKAADTDPTWSHLVLDYIISIKTGQ